MLFLLIIGCGQSFPKWVPLTEDMQIINVKQTEDKYTIAVTTEFSLQELHSFYNQAFNGWDRIQWDYQPAQNTIDLTIQQENKKVKVSGNLALCKTPKCAITIVAWE